MNKKLEVSLFEGNSRLSRAAFLEACGAAFDADESMRSASTDKIAIAVSGLFDAHRGERLSQQVIATHVLQKIGFTPANHATLSGMITAYVQENTGEQGDGFLFASKKGRGGGTWRQSDYVAPTDSK